MSGPSPLDRPTFPKQFLEECRSLVRRPTVPHDRRQRARLVLLLHESPDLSNVAAGARWNCTPIPSNAGVAVGHAATSPWLIKQAVDASPLFPPRDRAIVKVIACESVCQTKLPLSRLSISDLAAELRWPRADRSAPVPSGESSTLTGSNPGGISTGSLSKPSLGPHVTVPTSNSAVMGGPLRLSPRQSNAGGCLLHTC